MTTTLYPILMIPVIGMLLVAITGKKEKESTRVVSAGSHTDVDVEQSVSIARLSEAQKLNKEYFEKVKVEINARMEKLHTEMESLKTQDIKKTQRINNIEKEMSELKALMDKLVDRLLDNLSK